MRVAFVGQKGFPATYGGVEKVVDRVARGFAARGHQCVVYSRRYYSDSPCDLANIEVRHISGLRSKRLEAISHTFVSLMDTLTQRVDIVAIHSFPNAILSWIPKLAGRKVAMHLHGFEWDSGKWNGLDKMLLKAPVLGLKWFPDTITTVSSSQSSYLLDGHIPVNYIPNGIDAVDLDGDKYNSDSEYILFVGRLVPGKGVEYLISAFREAHLGNVSLFIVGEANNAPEYAGMLNDLAAGDGRIVFLGNKYGNELDAIYRGARMIVIPSEMEGHPMVLLEALAFRKCIIASRIPPIESVAGNSVLYFKPRDSADLANVLQHVFEGADVVKRAEENLSDDRLVREYNWERIIDKYESLYESLLV